MQMPPHHLLAQIMPCSKHKLLFKIVLLLQSGLGFFKFSDFCLEGGDLLFVGDLSLFEGRMVLIEPKRVSVLKTSVYSKHMGTVK